MNVKVNVSDALKGLDAKNADFLRAINFATTQVGYEAVAVMKNQIQGAHKSGTPTPSAPNTPPTNITGNLRRSITSTSRRGFGLTYIATVGPGMVYSRALELGMGKNNVKYPFVLPTAKIMINTGRARATYVSALRYALSN
jgi:hypothetical protein